MFHFPSIFQTSLLSTILGFLISQSLSYLPHPLAFYLLSLSLFHLFEHLLTALHNPLDADVDSFLINHSKEYTIAHMIALMEFMFLNRSANLKTLGVVVTLLGFLIRAIAIHTAGPNFNHQVQETRKQGHRLVKDGIYK